MLSRDGGGACVLKNARLLQQGLGSGALSVLLPELFPAGVSVKFTLLPIATHQLLSGMACR